MTKDDTVITVGKRCGRCRPGGQVGSRVGDGKAVFASSRRMKRLVDEDFESLDRRGLEVWNHTAKIDNDGIQNKLLGGNLRGPIILSTTERVGDGLDSVEGKSRFGIARENQRERKGWIVISVRAQ